MQPDREAEAEFIVARSAAWPARASPYEEMAVLYRLNARSEDYEEALALAGHPVPGARGGVHPAPRRAANAAPPADRRDASAVGAVAEAVRQQGWVASPPSGLGEEELTRQADLGRLLALAEQLPAGSSVGDFLRDLETRFGAESQGKGVHLLTYHRAKGLEWEAVFLPRLEEKELPYGKARTAERLAEERRLFYVGITRAKRWLAITWTAGEKPSRFLKELGVVAASRPKEKPGSTPEFEALRRWRAERAKADEVPAYVVFHDATLHEIAAVRPQTREELSSISGVGPDEAGALRRRSPRGAGRGLTLERYPVSQWNSSCASFGVPARSGAHVLNEPALAGSSMSLLTSVPMPGPSKTKITVSPPRKMLWRRKPASASS